MRARWSTSDPEPHHELVELDTAHEERTDQPTLVGKTETLVQPDCSAVVGANLQGDPRDASSLRLREHGLAKRGAKARAPEIPPNRKAQIGDMPNPWTG